MPDFTPHFVESDSVATEQSRADSPTRSKKRGRVESVTPPSDKRASLRMTAGRRAALSRSDYY